MEEIIVTDHFFKKFNERVGKLDKDNLVAIIKETPVEKIYNSFNENCSYAKIELKGVNYFVAYRYDSDSGNLILLTVLDEEIFLSKQRREFIDIFRGQMPQTGLKRRFQIGDNGYRRDIFAKTKDGRISREKYNQS